jgi:hypothetical protein
MQALGGEECDVHQAAAAYLDEGEVALLNLAPDGVDREA